MWRTTRTNTGELTDKADRGGGGGGGGQRGLRLGKGANNEDEDWERGGGGL